MLTTHISRRALALGVAGLPAAFGAAPRVLAAANNTAAAAAHAEEGLSQSSQAIHQEVSVSSSRQRVYGALTSAKEFDALTRLSDAVTLVTAPNAQATAISGEAGGSFTLFGGYITGRHLEMVPGERLVQAWRAGSWQPGDYSVVKFALFDQGAGCKIVLDHRGFPEGQGASLAYGWRIHYWEPLTKLLANSSSP
jgi:activator of HSP90 ATPase